MPRVQAYGQQQVRRAALPTARRTVQPDPDASGAGLGQALTQSFGTLSIRIADQARLKADQLALLSADRQLAEWENARLYDPEKGALALKGKDTFALPETLRDEFDQVAGQIEAGLTSDRQRLAFQRTRVSRAQSIDLTVRRHVFGQMQAYDQEETAAYVKAATQAAVANAMDPARVSSELGRAVAAVRDHAKRSGMGPEATNERVLATQTAVHTGVIDRLLTGEQDQAARVYFDAVKDQIDGGAIARVEKALAEGSLRGESQRQADSITRAGGTQAQRLEKVRAIENPELRDAVQQRVLQDWSLEQQAARESAENLMVTAANAIDKGGIRAVSPSLWSQLEPGQRVALESYAKRHATGADGGDSDAGLVTFYQLRRMAVDDPEKFKQENLLMHIGKLGKTEFKQIVDLQADLRKGGSARSDEERAGFRTELQVVDDTLAQHQVPTSGKDADQALLARFRRTVSERVAVLEKSTNKKATEQDVQAIADDIITRGVAVPGGLIDRLLGRPYIGKRLVDVTVADIPRATRRQIEQALTRAGAPVNDQTIVQTFIDQQLKAGR